MSAPLVSIIVPIYNREKTLPFCIEGILASTERDFELLLVDDGSSDGSPGICREYARKDGRVRVFRQENSGVGTARNLGLDNASGEWILFVDSDDSIFPDCLGILKDSGLGPGTDLVKFESAIPRRAGEKDGRPDHGPGHSGKHFSGNSAVIDYLFTGFRPYRNPYYCVWDKFFKRSLIEKHHLRFRADVTLGEDQIFTCAYLRHASGLFHTPQAGRAMFIWDPTSRPDGLGGILRTPEDFFHCQKENHKALLGLFGHSGHPAVKAYADNYIVDRPLTRILFRYSMPENRKKYPYGKLKEFFLGTVVPYFSENRIDADAVENKMVRRIYGLLIRKHFLAAYYAAFWITVMSDVWMRLRHFARILIVGRGE